MSIIRVLKKFRKILSRHQKMRIAELIFLMIIGGILEMMSVSLIMPFVNLVINSDDVMDKGYVREICNIINVNHPKKLLFLTAIILAIIYILKNIYLLFEYNLQYKFVYRNMFSMQSKLLDNYVHRPYEFFLSVESGEIIRIVNSDIPNTFDLLIVLLNLLTELAVSSILIATVFIIAPFTTIFIAILLMVFMMMINWISKPLLNNAGKESQKALAGMNKWLIQAIHGIKEIKVMMKEGFFQEEYDFYGRRYIQALRKNRIMGIVPRFFIEAVSMSVLFIAFGGYIYMGDNIERTIPMLSAMAMASLRLLPSVNRISSSLAGIAYQEPMLDALMESLKEINGNPDNDGGINTRNNHEFLLESKINFQNISFRYPGVEREILNNASFSINRGETIGIVGSSGAGKTTAIDIILGLLNPKVGQVLVDDKDIRDNIESWYKMVGYIPQVIFMMDASIKENIAFGLPEKEVSDELVMKSLEEASLIDYVKQLPDGWDTQIGERGIRLSGGQRQRIGIARALYRQAEVLIFDEATSALDHQTEEEIMKSIHQLQGEKTMIIIAHRTTTLETCDHIYQIEDGEIHKVR